MNAKKPKRAAVLEPPAGFKDPRLIRGFDIKHWPTCNGQAAPLPGATDLHDRRCLEFLAAYYELNVLNHNLLQARRKRADQKAIRAILARINRASDTLEKLEDRYAPVGFYGEPTMDGIRYKDIAFVRPELPRIYPSAASQCSYIAIPGLEDIPATELRGPVRILRFGHGHGKVGI